MYEDNFGEYTASENEEVLSWIVGLYSNKDEVNQEGSLERFVFKNWDRIKVLEDRLYDLAEEILAEGDSNNIYLSPERITNKETRFILQNWYEIQDYTKRIADAIGDDEDYDLIIGDYEPDPEPKKSSSKKTSNSSANKGCIDLRFNLEERLKINKKL